MKSRFSRMLVLVAATALAAGCDRGDQTPPPAMDTAVEFGTGSVRIETATDTIRIPVEVAETDAQRRVGLMARDQLAADAGMIFLFQEQQPADGVFWMFNTRIPLSIAFIGPDGRIGSIRDMEPCTSPYPQWCPNYESGVPFNSALEVNRGFFAARGVAVGDRVVLER